MSAPVDVLAAIGESRMDTGRIARKCGLQTAAALRELRVAEAAGDVVSELADVTYWRRGAARPLIWRATPAALARVQP